MAPDPPPTLDAAELERWFLSRGLPHFIDGYNASRDVFTRALPVLVLVLVIELVGVLNSAWVWWINAFVGVASFGALLAVWGGVNVARGQRWRALPQSVGPAELAVFLLLPAALPAVAGGQWLTAINTLVGNVVLLGLVYLVTSYGVIPMTRWAAGRLVAQLGDVLGLMVRALPLLLLFVVFLFLSSEVWQVGSALDGPYLALVVGLFVSLGVAFVVGRIPREVGSLARFESAEALAAAAAGTPVAAELASRATRADELAARESGPPEAKAPPLAKAAPPAPPAPAPLAPPAPAPLAPTATPTPPAPPADDNDPRAGRHPLTRRQWGNVGLVVLFSQGLQIAFASAMIGLFLVALGVVAIPPATVALWTAAEVTPIVEAQLWGRDVALTTELVQVAVLLAAVSGFSFTLSLLTDTTYRQEFLEDTLSEVRQAFAVRSVYLDAASGRPPAE